MKSTRNIPYRILRKMPHILDWIPEIEAIDGDVLSTTLLDIGLLSKNDSRARQLDELGLSVRSKSRAGNGFIYSVAKEDVLALLRGMSELAPSQKRIPVLENPCQQSPSPQSVEKIQRDFVATVDALYELQQENHRQIQALLKKSPAEPPAAKPTASPAAPARTTDLDRWIVKLEALEEANLAFLKRNRDVLERCEAVFDRASEHFEMLAKQNRHLWKKVEEMMAGLACLMEAFEIAPSSQ